ncbi:efflux RND transporter periplasmic adaptor subunit [Halopseudomonas nanhaiensis]|uniref:efflux RND transporter periplasmic adaptor subunit n=1 Tax=Halopseudomonas nanhaiensis TaxID=2830842 RepID=UPI001CC14C85|nr:efflux RND transporter periplasmic adaptor subunit [Halopseudomonas nanhaiensis]UAW97233.1 efflux RND transporter periplasmic adaptor subunit [Halopseudomonas nanhaiensis]
MTSRLGRFALLMAMPVMTLAIAVHAQQDGSSDREVLYWYDPMYPQQKFDAPGPSPFMDMDLVPRYADQGGDRASISIDPGIMQNLGMRLATAQEERISQSIEAVGTLEYNQRKVAQVQARSAGFVERVYDLAPDDIIEQGAPLVDVFIPEWATAQEEYLALRDLDVPDLLAAARQRLRLVGMPAETIQALERSGRASTTWTISSPIDGVVQELDVREGMTVAAGDSLVRINGLDTVWLEVAVPEAQVAELRPGQSVTARLPAFRGEHLEGTITAVLPSANIDSRTVRVRAELPNPERRLRPGMTAEVSLSSDETTALMVPSEAVIRTGRRNLVMLAEGEGRFRPVEVRVGRESGDRTEILEGLESGQQVVASGQFLLDSEASLRGLTAQTPGASSAPADPGPSALHEAEGTVIGIDGDMLGLEHGPFETLGMPGMTMPFPVADMQLLEGIEPGDRVRVGVSESDDGLTIERIEQLPNGASGDGHKQHNHGEHQP